VFKTANVGEPMYCWS